MEEKKAIIFVNGYTHACKPLEPYWTEKGMQFIENAKTFFDCFDNNYFINGEGPWYSGAKYRFKKGKIAGENFIENYDLSNKKEITFYFVTHSMGAAFAEGMVETFFEHQVKVEKIVHFSPADASGICIPLSTKNVLRIQLNLDGDKTLSKIILPFYGLVKYKIPLINIFGYASTNIEELHPTVSKQDKKKWDFHYDTKTFAYVWDYIKKLEKINSQINSKVNSFSILKSDNLTFKLLGFGKDIFFIKQTNSSLTEDIFIRNTKRKCFFGQ